MTATLRTSSGSAVSTRVRATAWLCVVAGVLGAASGVVLAAWSPSVGTERFSYPQSAEAFTGTQVWFGFHHLGLVAGVVGLRWSGVLPAGRPARWGWWMAFVGIAGLTVTELLAIAAADAAADSGVASAVGGLYGFDCTAIGLGLLLAGAAIWRDRAWVGWRRGVVLALGAWVFVPMFPALIVTPADGARIAIAGWMLLFGALGAALLARPTGQAR